MFEQNVTLGPGTATFTQHTFEILIMLLGAFLLGLWLGWLLWGRFKQMINQLRTENQSLSVTGDALRAELNAARTKVAELETDAANMASQVATLSNKNGELRDTLSELEEQLAGLSARNRKVETELGLSFEPETPLAAADIPLEISLPEPEFLNTIPEPIPLETPDEAIAAAAPSELLTAAQNLMLPDLSDDSDLAGMAPLEDNPHWEAFTIADSDIVQEPETNPVPDPLTTPESPVAPEQIESPNLAPAPELPAAMAGGADSDDLTVIEGIGPKIQELLHQYGIRTYAELAETNVQKLKEILMTAGPQLAMHDPGTWPSQANLAANDEWESLKAIQSFLKGGKAPK